MRDRPRAIESENRPDESGRAASITGNITSGLASNHALGGSAGPAGAAILGLFTGGLAAHPIAAAHKHKPHAAAHPITICRHRLFIATRLRCRRSLLS
jgi:outer membrane lipoprotein SlyB